MKYGYVRCSTKKQEFDRQEYILKDYNCDKIFKEKISGCKKANDRPEFEKMLNELKPNDTIYFTAMSRMARSMQDLIDTTNYIIKVKKCNIVFIKENINAGSKDNAMTNLLFNIMGSFAQFERDMISERTKQGLRAKKAMGVKLGKKLKYSKAIINQIIELKNAGNSYQKIADIMEMPKSTIVSIYKRESENV